MSCDLMVIDAHAMAYRAYYALQRQNLRHPVTGQPTFAIQGFFLMLVRLMEEHQPESLVITWDPPRKSFRFRLFESYKATRKPMPEDLRPQIEEIQALVKEANIFQIMATDHEADDVMGTLAYRFGSSTSVVLVTGDKDCFQLLHGGVVMLRPLTGVTEYRQFDPAEVEKELGVSVDQVCDYMGLVGDSSDNIPGAKGVGPKGAVELIKKYHSIEGIYENLDRIQGSIKKKLEDSKEIVILSKKLATIATDVPEAMTVDLKAMHTPAFFSSTTAQIFRNAGYNRIHDEMMKVSRKFPELYAKEGASAPLMSDSTKSRKDKSAPANPDGLEQPGLFSDSTLPQSSSKSASQYSRGDFHLVETEEQLAKMVQRLSNAKILAVDTETDSRSPMRARLVGASFSAGDGNAYYVALPPPESPYHASGIPLEKARPLLARLLENEKIAKVGQNIKYDRIVLQRHGIRIENILFDTMIGSYLLNPNVRRHNLDDMALDYLQHQNILYEEVVGKGKNQLTMDLLPPSSISDYACEDAEVTYRIYEILAPKIKENSLTKVNEELELPLISVLSRMEMKGIAIDLPYFAGLAKDYEKKLKSLEKKIHNISGYDFNINSTKELQKLLFDELKLPKGRKNKTGYSTDQSVLEDLRGKHPVVDHLLDHRKFSKLKSTYVDALPQMVNPDTGRLHTSFNQTIAATGRLSSNDPNLQNIPIKEEEGRAIRAGFIPGEGNRMLSLDYSQIELRIMAHYAKDPALIEAFVKDDIDIHARTAASLFGVQEDEVDRDMRAKAKVVNFSIIYGVTEFGLSQNLNISREEARLYIERFFQRYPGVKQYMKDTIAFAEQKGFVTTIMGRQRQIPDITSSVKFRREGAERTAINTPIQGSSADIIKKAMIEIQKKFDSEKIKSSMILQVHDELIFDVVPEEEERVLGIAKKAMENAAELNVPLRVDGKFGTNWQEAH